MRSVLSARFEKPPPFIARLPATVVSTIENSPLPWLSIPPPWSAATLPTTETRTMSTTRPLARMPAPLPSERLADTCKSVSVTGPSEWIASPPPSPADVLPSNPEVEIETAPLPATASPPPPSPATSGTSTSPDELCENDEAEIETSPSVCANIPPPFASVWFDANVVRTTASDDFEELARPPPSPPAVFPDTLLSLSDTTPSN